MSRLLVASAVALLFLGAASPADARNPPNPYSSFNLSGINYGAMQWERDQRAGKRVWPYFNQPSASRGRSGAAVGGLTGGGGAGVVRQGGGRGWRRGRR